MKRDQFDRLVARQCGVKVTDAWFRAIKYHIEPILQVAAQVASQKAHYVDGNGAATQANICNELLKLSRGEPASLASRKEGEKKP